MSQRKKNSTKETQIWQLPEKLLPEIRKNVAVIIAKLGPKFQFGPYELEDLESQALLWINDKFDRYDKSRAKKNGLFNFMYTVIKNKLYNLKRNEFSRLDPPCTKCPLNAYINKQCTAYEQLEDCSYYAKWLKINRSKEQLMSVYSADDSKDDNTRSPLESMISSEELQSIWNRLSEKHKKTMEDVLTNEKVNKVRLNNLIKECRWILEHDEEHSADLSD